MYNEKTALEVSLDMRPGHFFTFITDNTVSLWSHSEATTYNHTSFIFNNARVCACVCQCVTI